MKALIDDYSIYNEWANRQIIDFFAQQPDELSTQSIISSFPSVRDTLLHIWDAEIIWLRRLEGESLEAFPSASFEGDIREIYKHTLENSAAFKAHVLHLSQKNLETYCHFKDTKGNAYQQIRYEIIQHTMNHSSFHRGQLITMARQLRLTPLPRTDYIYYLRLKK